MGNLACVNSMVNSEVQEFNWGELSKESTYTALFNCAVDDTVSSHLCQKACENIHKNNSLGKLMERTVSGWGEGYLPSNLMILMKQIFIFVFSEGIPYQFMYKGEEEKRPDEVHNTPLHRLVPCDCHFMGEQLTLHISIPQTSFYDRERENQVVLSSIKRGFAKVRQYLVNRNDQLFLVDENGDEVDIDRIYTFYSYSASGDQLSDPFGAPKKQTPIFKIYIKTTESSMGSEMGVFIGSLIEKLSACDLSTDMHKIHAGVGLLLVLLSSHVYYSDNSTYLEYSNYKVSPTLYLLSRVALETAQRFSYQLLCLITKYWKSTKKPTFITYMLFYTNLDSCELEMKEQISKQSLMLLVLLNTYTLSPNPYLLQNWQMEWEPFYSLIIENLDDNLILMLFLQLIKENRSFYGYTVSLTEPEKFLEKLSYFVYSSPADTFKFYITMIVILVFTQDKLFVKFINNDVLLPQPNWLKDYQIESISLGSTLYLSLIRLFRENIRSDKGEYIHVLTCGCLFNISEHSTNLHELAAMQTLGLLKGLFNKYQQLSTDEENVHGTERIKESFNILLEIIMRTLYYTLKNNIYLVYALLHHAELIECIGNSELMCKNVEILQGMVEHYMGLVNSESILESILKITASYEMEEKPHFLVFADISTFEYKQIPEQWESAMVPHIWSEFKTYMLPTRTSKAFPLLVKLT